MQRSEYETQALINDGLNQQQAFDSQEGSAALLQANKPQVDGTDIEKARFLAEFHDQQPTDQSVTSNRIIKSNKTLGKIKTNKPLIEKYQ